MAHIGIAGAGFSGAVIARELAEAGHDINVVDARDHIGGNSHTQRNADGVMVHIYGPHIFHTQHQNVWDYVNRFGVMMPYNHRVKALAKGRAYSLPVNLLTINQFFNKTFSPAEAEAFVHSIADTTISTPITFEDQALRFVGRDLYEAFFKGYTKKQWGVDPTELPASILARLPVRFNYEDSYFNHPYQAIARDGYTEIIAAILDHPRITVELGKSLGRADAASFDHMFWTGPIDAYFDFEHGRLGYRTLDFESEVHDGDYQGCPVLNYCDEDVPFTRITEHKHFAPWESHDRTVIYREFSRLCGEDDIPYYPIRLVKEKEQLGQYVELARREANATFVGRLGTYRYLDMDVTIFEALKVATGAKEALMNGESVPSFFVDPLGS